MPLLAQVILDTMTISTVDDSLFDALYSTLIAAYTAGRTIISLTQGELAVVADLASHNEPAAVYAKSIMRLVANVDPNPDIEQWGTLKNSAKQQNSEAEIRVVPNPFQKTTNVTVELNEESDATLRVMDISGRVIQVHHLEALNGTGQIVLKDLPGGVLVLRFEKAGIEPSVIKLISL